MAVIWVATSNPFDLPEPPAWWQQAVFDYDQDLRVMPSLKDRVYRLCRVVRREARLGLKSMVVHDHPDTRFMIEQGMVPIATLHRFHPQIVAELQSRDLWRAENRNAVDQLEEAERLQEEAKQRADDDELLQRAGDAFRGLQYVKGERLSLREINRGRKGPTLTPNRVKVAVRQPDAVITRFAKNVRAFDAPPDAVADQAA